VIKPGARRRRRRVVHPHLDDQRLGTAKAGRVEKIIDLDNQELVQAQYDDGSDLTTDRREVHFPRWTASDSAPMITRWDHLRAALDLRLPFLGLMLAVVISLVLALALFILGRQPLVVLSVAAIFSAYSLWMVRILTTEKIIDSQPGRDRRR